MGWGGGRREDIIFCTTEDGCVLDKIQLGFRIQSDSSVNWLTKVGGVTPGHGEQLHHHIILWVLFCFLGYIAFQLSFYLNIYSIHRRFYWEVNFKLKQHLSLWFLRIASFLSVADLLFASKLTGTGCSVTSSFDSVSVFGILIIWNSLSS